MNNSQGHCQGHFCPGQTVGPLLGVEAEEEHFLLHFHSATRWYGFKLEKMSIPSPQQIYIWVTILRK